jgi:hypothetical protein
MGIIGGIFSVVLVHGAAVRPVVAEAIHDAFIRLAFAARGLRGTTGGEHAWKHRHSRIADRAYAVHITAKRVEVPGATEDTSSTGRFILVFVQILVLIQDVLASLFNVLPRVVRVRDVSVRWTGKVVRTSASGFTARMRLIGSRRSRSRVSRRVAQAGVLGIVTETVAKRVARLPGVFSSRVAPATRV